MSHQKDFVITVNSEAEMIAVRAVLIAFDYPLYEGFRTTIDLMSNHSFRRFDCVRFEGAGCARSMLASTYGLRKMTLAEFIEQQAIPVKTPAQLELEKLEASATELNARIAALKASL